MRHTTNHLLAFSTIGKVLQGPKAGKSLSPFPDLPKHLKALDGRERNRLCHDGPSPHHAGGRRELPSPSQQQQKTAILEEDLS